MATFIAKQMVGKQLGQVKGALGDKEDEKGGKEEEEEDPEIAEARREAEEKRKDKHRKMEEEREEMRQSIRDKYGLKKKVQEVQEEPDCEGRLGRKRKSPEQLAAEANADSDDDMQNSVFPKDLNDLTTKVQEIPGKVMSSVSEATEKCVMQWGSQMENFFKFNAHFHSLHNNYLQASGVLTSLHHTLSDLYLSGSSNDYIYRCILQLSQRK